MIDLANDIRAEVDHAAEQYRAWSDEDASVARGPDKWTRKEILGHLIDSAANNHMRFVLAQLAGGRFTAPSYAQNDWVAMHGYRDRSWRELLHLWVALNHHLAVIVSRMPDAHRSILCTIGSDRDVTLEWVMTDYLRHMRHHLAQIEG